MHNESYRMNQALRIIRNTFAHSCVMYNHVHNHKCTSVLSLDRNATVVRAKVILSWTTTAMWTIKLRLVAPTLVRISKFDREKDFSTLLWIHKIHHKNGLQKETDPMDVWDLQGQNEIVGAIKSEWLSNCDVPVCMFLGPSPRFVIKDSSMPKQALGKWAMQHD